MDNNGWVSVEELLKPRYEVIADYPNSPYKIGKILYGVSNHKDILLSDYPHPFRPLAWYEKRDVSEMPEYVKIRGKVYEIYKWSDEEGYFIRLDTMEMQYCDKYLPATEQEYLSYINKNKTL